MLKALIRTMRPKQWYKNILIFVGLVFSANLFNLSMWLQVIYAFLIFCALSGSEYIINDILDAEKDRKHPIKSKRPIASGELKIAHATAFSIFLIVVSLFGAYWITPGFFSIAILFVVLTLTYSFWLKHIILVDALLISVDFVIRATAGMLAINVALSPWIIMCAFLLALLLVFGKRRHEVILLGEEAESHRKILKGYSIGMLESIINMTAGALILSYALHTFLAGNLWMMITIPVVSYAIFRYLFLVYSKNIGGEPEIIFKDKGMVISMVIWIVLSIAILYDAPAGILELLGY